MGKIFAISLLVCFTVAFAGSAVTTPSIDTWYATLQKSWFNPPNWLFGPVWTLLYFLMSASLALVWNHGLHSKKIRRAVTFFFAQLALNFLWSFVFFGLHLPFVAFAVITALWMSILKTIQVFRPISPRAAYLLYPYLAWVSFAALLNLSIALLNP